MGLKNKIKGFIRERMPFVVRYVRSLKGAKNIHDEINHEIKEMLEAKNFILFKKKLYSAMTIKKACFWLSLL
ncbi:hypothetical protein Taiwan55_02360 [Helicobacter pylori]